MNQNSHFKLFGVLGLLAFGAASTLAQQCPTNTLDLYINSFTAPGNGCIQGSQNNVENYGFTFETRSVSGGNSDVASNILVTPNNPAATLGFSGFESLPANGGDIEYFIGYNIDPPPILTGDSISLDPFNPGTATLNLYVCQGDTPFFLGDNDGTFECGSTFSGFSGGTSAINLADPDASVNSTTPNATFGFPPTSQVGILLELTLNAGTTGTGEGTFGSDPAVQGTVPEPASFLLVGLALTAAIGFRKFIQNRLRAR
jgi:hypothetical protein